MTLETGLNGSSKTNGHHTEQQHRGRGGPCSGQSGDRPSGTIEHVEGRVGSQAPSPRTVAEQGHDAGQSGKLAAGRSWEQSRGRKTAGGLAVERGSASVVPLGAGFSRDQLKKLVRGVNAKHLQSRELEGKRLTYIEGWYAIAQANAIFGHAGWDREMVHFERVMEKVKSDSIVICGYMARVRIRVRAGSTEVIREGTGWGSASASTATAANERALKAAETDATKRALSTFGASFGLSLYDKDHVPAKPRPAFTLFAPDGKVLDDTLSPEAYCTGLRQLIEACKGTHQVDQLSRHNRASLTDLRIQVPTLRNAQGIHFADLLLRLMHKRRERLGAAHIASGDDPGTNPERSTRAKPDPENLPTEVGIHSGPASYIGDAKTDNSGAMGATPVWAHGRDNESGRTAIGPGAAFSRFTGQSARRCTPYPLPSRSEPRRKPGGTQYDARTTRAETKEAEEDHPIVAEAVSLAALSTSPAAADKVATPEKAAPHSGGNNAASLTGSIVVAEPVATPSKIAFGLKIDKSRLLLGFERRLRDKAHLRRVAELPCLVCNRQPSHAHHLRFAQRRGLSQKVSDEYVVPLCALHHGDLHRSSSEQDWWAKQRIDPLVVSAELWDKYRSD